MQTMKHVYDVVMVFMSVIYVLLFVTDLSVVGGYLGLGIVAGILFPRVAFAFSGNKLWFKLADGILRIDRTNPFDENYKLEMHTDPSTIRTATKLDIVVDPFAHIGGGTQ